jgi:hypothetical protein
MLCVVDDHPQPTYRLAGDGNAEFVNFGFVVYSSIIDSNESLLMMVGHF